MANLTLNSSVLATINENAGRLHYQSRPAFFTIGDAFGTCAISQMVIELSLHTMRWVGEAGMKGCDVELLITRAGLLRSLGDGFMYDVA